MVSYFQNYLVECVNSPTAVVGLVASFIVLISMCFNTSTKRGNILMRSINLVGSIICVIYGLLLGPSGAGTILLNGVLVFVNSWYLIKYFR